MSLCLNLGSGRIILFPVFKCLCSGRMILSSYMEGERSLVFILQFFCSWRMICVEGERFIVPVLQLFCPCRMNCIEGKLLSPCTPTFLSMENEMYLGRDIYSPCTPTFCPWRMIWGSSSDRVCSSISITYMVIIYQVCFKQLFPSDSILLRK